MVALGRQLPIVDGYFRPSIMLATGQIECKRLVTSNANVCAQGAIMQGARDYPAAHHDVNMPAMILASRRAW